MEWNWILAIFVVPIAYLCICRILNVKANYYLSVIDKMDDRKIKFYTINKFAKYILISFLLFEDKVAKRVLILSILGEINAIFMCVSAVISYFIVFKYIPIIFYVTGLIIIACIPVNFYDKRVWGKKNKG